MVKIVKINIEIELRDFYLKCENCHISDNCYQTYKECRKYNSDIWNHFDKEIGKVRKRIFENLINKKRY
jgi:hypothetical protein